MGDEALLLFLPQVYHVLVPSRGAAASVFERNMKISENSNNPRDYTPSLIKA